MTAPLLVVALSGRALAQAALRAGRPARVVDLFGDEDTRAAAQRVEVVGGNLEDGLDPEAAASAADRLAPAGAEPAEVVYGSGLEARPALIARIGEGRRLRGNPAETVAGVKDPERLARLASSLGIAHPEIRARRPDEPGGWLVKRAGAAGGAHVAPANGTAPEGAYWQRRVAGRSLSVTFLADGARARRVGICEQWTAAEPDRPYRFGGVGHPVTLDGPADAALTEVTVRLTAALGLVGLNTADLILDADDRPWLIEVNPRPGASLDVLDRGSAAGLLGHHLAACEGRLPDDGAPFEPAGGAASILVFAAHAATTPTAALPAWVADRPAPGSRVPAGAPVCTVHAVAGDLAGARRLAARRAFEILCRLVPRPMPEEVPQP